MSKVLNTHGFHIAYRELTASYIVKWAFIETDNIIDAVNQANEYAKKHNLAIAHLIDEVTWRSRP
mgnify:FL=1